MISAALKDKAFLSEVQNQIPPHDHFRLWWLGQSGFLIQWETEHLLLDPYLSDSLTKKYHGTDKPHVRMSERVVDPARLDFIDIATSSHNHTDHLDAETLCPLMEVNPNMNVLVPRANRLFAAQRLKVDDGRLAVIDAGESLRLGSFSLHAVPAAHEELEKDENGWHRFIGLVVKVGPWTIYHSGDTMLYEGMEELLRGFEIDLALLPINGRKPERRVAGNLWGDEAAKLADGIGASHVIPCHYDMFEFNTETTELFEKTCRELQQHFTILKGGETWVSTVLLEGR